MVPSRMEATRGEKAKTRHREEERVADGRSAPPTKKVDTSEESLREKD